MTNAALSKSNTWEYSVKIQYVCHSIVKRDFYGILSSIRFEKMVFKLYWEEYIQLNLFLDQAKYNVFGNGNLALKYIAYNNFS